MDIQAIITTTPYRTSFFFRAQRSSSSPSFSPPIRPSCSRNQDPNGNGDSSNGGKYSTDWDKAWAKFKKQGKKNLFSGFSPNKYVTWNPKRSEYPLAEEVDPIKRIERSNLRLWTSPRFTLVGAIVILTFLLVYIIIAPINK